MTGTWRLRRRPTDDASCRRTTPAYARTEAAVAGSGSRERRLAIEAGTNTGAHRPGIQPRAHHCRAERSRGHDRSHQWLEERRPEESARFSATALTLRDMVADAMLPQRTAPGTRRHATVLPASACCRKAQRR